MAASELRIYRLVAHRFKLDDYGESWLDQDDVLGYFSTEEDAVDYLNSLGYKLERFEPWFENSVPTWFIWNETKDAWDDTYDFRVDYIDLVARKNRPAFAEFNNGDIVRKKEDQNG